MADKRVLIVDDERDIVEAIKFSLKLENIESIEAYDGEEALSKAQKENPDLILLDIMLPKINGYAVCTKLKYNDLYTNIPIIMLTAKAQEDDKAFAKQTRADEYVTKPFDMNKLISLVKEYLNRSN
jgi:two-component system response regulator VicR